jgi:glycosyltransferase involved in cell wall biosynthesis
MKKVFMFVNVDWFFLSHRLPIAIVAAKNNIDMSVYTDFTKVRDSDGVNKFKLLRSPLGRVAKYPGYEFIELIKVFFLIRKRKPHLIHAVTIKPMILLGIVARLTNTPFVGAISGLGPAFIQTGWKSKLRLALILKLYRFIFRSPESGVICQSKNDVDFLLKAKVCDRLKIFIIEGSGVDLKKYSPDRALDSNESVILMASRILSDKGVLEFCAAAKILQNENKSHIKFKLAGPIDLLSPTSIPKEKLLSICLESGVEYLGNRSDLDVLLASAKLFVYPSYYPEGIPKVLLEAAASGTPVLTTDHPGCRDAIIYGKTGFTVEPKDEKKLAKMISQMLADEKLADMGVEGRKLAEEFFDQEKVIESHYKIYAQFL